MLIKHRRRFKLTSTITEAARPLPANIDAPAPVSRRAADLATERDAISVARTLAQKMGCSVTVRDTNYNVIETVPAPSVH